MVVTKQFKVDQKGGLQNFDDTEEEDALSLCDLPLNSEFSDWNDFSDDYQSSSFDSDVFEFFSEDVTSSTKPTDNIIFCGKLIPFKEEATTVQHQEQELKNTGKSCILPWRSRTTFSKENRARSCRGFYNHKTLSTQQTENGGCGSCSNGDKYDSKIKEASIMATPVKSSRWHVLAFGVGRFPAKMGLSDVKNRQTKRNPSTKCDSDQSGAIQNGKSSHGKGAKSLWSLLRMLSLKGHPANNTIMKASVGCFPL